MIKVKQLSVSSINVRGVYLGKGPMVLIFGPDHGHAHAPCQRAARMVRNCGGMAILSTPSNGQLDRANVAYIYLLHCVPILTN